MANSYFRNQSFIKKQQEAAKAKKSGEAFIGFYQKMAIINAEKQDKRTAEYLEGLNDGSRKDGVQIKDGVEKLPTEDHQGEKDNL